MRSPLKIGITGGIGSGKTTVTRLFERFNIPVYYSDERAKWLMNNNSTIIKKVTELFGINSYHNKELNRKHISALAFSNKNLIKELNETVHPAVFNDFETWVEQQTSPYLLKEAAILFESGSYLTLDAMIVVDAPLELRIERVIKRDGSTHAEVLKRIDNQMNDEVKKNAADFIINNDGEALIPQILMLHKLWI